MNQNSQLRREWKNIHIYICIFFFFLNLSLSSILIFEKALVVYTCGCVKCTTPPRNTYTYTYILNLELDLTQNTRSFTRCKNSRSEYESGNESNGEIKSKPNALPTCLHSKPSVLLFICIWYIYIYIYVCGEKWKLREPSESRSIAHSSLPNQIIEK